MVHVLAKLNLYPHEPYVLLFLANLCYSGEWGPQDQRIGWFNKIQSKRLNARNGPQEEQFLFYSYASSQTHSNHDSSCNILPSEHTDSTTRIARPCSLHAIFYLLNIQTRQEFHATSFGSCNKEEQSYPGELRNNNHLS